MTFDLTITPGGRPALPDGDPPDAPVWTRRVRAAAATTAGLLLHLGSVELQTALPPGMEFAREWARQYLTKLCQTQGLDDPAASPEGALSRVVPVGDAAAMVAARPPIRGAEYLTEDVLVGWWGEMEATVRAGIAATDGGATAYLHTLGPQWRTVGRVMFHLAENKRDPEHPFAFLATYADHVSAGGRVGHQPLGGALQQYAGDRTALLSLLTPVSRAAEQIDWVRALVDSGDVYHPMRWAPRQAYKFLRDVPKLEEAGLVVRVPDWWKPTRPPRPVVSVKIGGTEKSRVGVDAVLNFSVGVTLDEDPLTEAEMEALRASAGGLVLLKNKWVEVDPAKLDEALKHWKQVERQARGGGISFFEGMRLLSHVELPGDTARAGPTATAAWTGITADAALSKTLAELRDPATIAGAAPVELKATLRPYQQTGVNWLRFMSRLNLGACLADDMGLGKTIQVISLLLHVKQGRGGPSLLVLPASLIGNWKAEIERFAPTLTVAVVHTSERGGVPDAEPDELADHDLVVTTYGVLVRTGWLRDRRWRLAILDEAQAIKNSGTRQSKAVKELRAGSRIALTGTPVENRLSDLWSIFDFLNPGLLGTSKAFAAFVKRSAEQPENKYGPLRSLVRPYILRRLKTDKRIIADLPDKTEVAAYCGLTKQQVTMYEQLVRDLSAAVASAEGMGRRGLILAALLRLKQVCNHPSQLTGDNLYTPSHSGKFARLREIAEQIATRQEKVLVFTQFREMTDPLHDYLATVFGRPGLVLHGATAVRQRRELVDAFQADGGPPFFVLSIKAGGTGLNLTAASHVVHFDRWWNPAVENQATDRAFRIGQKRNVLVHKFVCRGTVEERIDELIADKSGLARDLLADQGGDVLLTEMNNDQLLRMVSLDVTKAMEAG